jgi:glycerol-3-phosphate acyltransferase PlsY
LELPLDILYRLIALFASYLFGSISFSRVIARLVKPGTNFENVEMPVEGAEQSFKVTAVGGNTLSMQLGARAGCSAALLDGLKVFLPVLFLRLLVPETDYFLYAAVGGFAGHCWPIYYRFKGGRGVSAFFGGLFAFDPIGALVVAFSGLFLGMVVFRKVKALNVFLMYTGGVILVIPWIWLTKEPWSYLIYAVVINVLFFLAMAPDIQQSAAMIRKYGWKNVEIGMDQFAMGKGMSKMMRRLGLEKDGPTDQE